MDYVCSVYNARDKWYMHEGFLVWIIPLTY